MPTFAMPTFKSTFHADVRDAEFSPPPSIQRSNRLPRIIESVRLAITLLILLCGLTILGTTADALSVYNKTHLGQEFNLPLWPPARAFDVGPTVAILVGSAVVVVASAGAIGFSRVPTVCSFQQGFDLLRPSLSQKITPN